MRKTRNAVRALLAALAALIVVFVALVAASQPSGRAEEPSEVLEASEDYMVTQPICSFRSFRPAARRRP